MSPLTPSLDRQGVFQHPTHCSYSTAAPPHSGSSGSVPGQLRRSMSNHPNHHDTHNGYLVQHAATSTLSTVTKLFNHGLDQQLGSGRSLDQATPLRLCPELQAARGSSGASSLSALPPSSCCKRPSLLIPFDVMHATWNKLRPIPR